MGCEWGERYMYLLIRATGGIPLTASGPVLVQQPAAAGRVRASWQRRAYKKVHIHVGQDGAKRRSGELTMQQQQQVMSESSPRSSGLMGVVGRYPRSLADLSTDTDTDRVPSHTSRRDRRDGQHWRNPSRTFSRSAYDESPARCWRPSVRLERAHQAPDQGRRAPIAR